MTLNDYQEKAMGTCLPSCDNFSYMMLNLVGEVGELASKVAKAIRKEKIGMHDNRLHTKEFGTLKFQWIDHDLMSEAGDILWQLAGLCKVMGWSLEDVAQGNLDKLAARKAEGTMDKPFLHRLKARIVPVTQAPKATEEEGQKLLPKAVQVILYTACLHSALYDLMEEMTAIGEYRHAKKRNLNECIHRIGYIHNALHKSIGAHSHYFGRWYNEQLDNAEASIREHILIQSPHRAYSIVRAFFRLVEQSNEACGRWRCPAVVIHLPDALKLLERCEFPVEDKHIDFILQNCIDTKDLTKKITTDKFDK